VGEDEDGELGVALVGADSTGGSPSSFVMSANVGNVVVNAVVVSDVVSRVSGVAAAVGGEVPPVSDVGVIVAVVIDRRGSEVM